MSTVLSTRENVFPGKILAGTGARQKMPRSSAKKCQKLRVVFLGFLLVFVYIFLSSLVRLRGGRGGRFTELFVRELWASVWLIGPCRLVPKCVKLFVVPKHVIRTAGPEAGI